MTALMTGILLCLGSGQDADKDSSKDPNVRRISVDYDQVLLESVLADIQKRTGIPIEMDEWAKKEIDPSKEKFSMKAQDLSVMTILSLMLRQRSSLIQYYWVDQRKLVISAKH